MGARSFDLTERMLYLRSIPVGAVLPPLVLNVIARSLQDRVFQAGDALMREGEPIAAMHLLRSGGVSLTRNGVSIGELQPPQTLGFLGILARADGTYDAVAKSETMTFALDAEALLEIIEDHFTFLHATVRYAAERLYYEMRELPAEALALPSEPLPFAVSQRPLDLVERLLFLRQIRVFSQTNLNALAALSRQLKEVRYPAGTLLWSQGDSSEHALMLVSGTVECSTGQGKRFRYGTATVMGGIEGLAGKPRWYDATSAEPVVALLGRSDELVDLLEDDFSMGIEFTGMLASNLVALLERKAALGQSPLAVLRDVSKLGAVPVGA
jgi:CRP-like cAMP-binding protein